MNSTPYRNLEIAQDDGEITTMKRYLHAGTSAGGLGYGLVAQYGISGSDTRFFHSDMIGTTRLMTDSSGAIQSRLRWTAFGEPLPLVAGEPPYGYEQPSGAQTRYGYAGSWGYQNDGLAGNPPSGATLDIGLLHVGARYYDPAIGRFVMRDPIGLWGGRNVYEYVKSGATKAVDPQGLVLYVNISAATTIGSDVDTMSAAQVAAAEGALTDAIATIEASASQNVIVSGLVDGQLERALLNTQELKDMAVSICRAGLKALEPIP